MRDTDFKTVHFADIKLFNVYSHSGDFGQVKIGLTGSFKDVRQVIVYFTEFGEDIGLQKTIQEPRIGSNTSHFQ